MVAVASETAQLRRLAGRSLAAGLCVAAAVAVLALLSGSFDDTHWRVVGTSLGFSAFASTAAAGGALRLRRAAWAQVLGAATAASSAAALLLLVTALWISDADGVWRAFGVAGLCALWTSHASLVLRGLRPDDSALLTYMAVTSVGALGIDASVGVAALLGLLEDVDGEPFARVLAALLVIAILFTALPPLLRRFGPRADARVAGRAADVALGRVPEPFARQVAASADRLAEMELPVHARAEVERLRALARDAGG